MKARRSSVALLLGTVFALSGCASADGLPTEHTESTESALSRTQYIDIFDFLTDHGGPDAFLGAVQGLNNDFLNECGDTFCGSDYSNLTPLAFSCSVTKSEGKLKMCRYVFAGSYQTVIASTGTVVVNAKTFECTVPVKGTPAQLIAALTSTAHSPLHNTLPGETSTVYDAIGGCLP